MKYITLPLQEYETLEYLQNEAKKYFTWKTIDQENLYEWINTASFLHYETCFKILLQIDDENQHIVLDTDYVYWDHTFEEYLNWMIATYLEKYIKQNHKERWATRHL